VRNFKIQELELASFINKTPSTSETRAREDLKSFGELPRRCGVAAVENGAETLNKIIAHASEQSMQEKMLLLLKRWDEKDPEELLFQLLFKSLGFQPLSQVFEELAKQYQFSDLRPLFRQSQRHNMDTRTFSLF
jgi:hypothetical protein